MIIDTDFIGYHNGKKQWEIVKDVDMPDTGGPWYSIEIKRLYNMRGYEGQKGIDFWLRHLRDKPWFDELKFLNFLAINNL